MKKDEKTEETILHTCKSKCTPEEYGKMAEYFPEIYWNIIQYATISNTIFTAIMAIFLKNIIDIIICFIVYQICAMFIYKIRIKQVASKIYAKQQSKANLDSHFQTEFFEDYFVRRGETTTVKIQYSDITKGIETDTNFYLKINKPRCVVFIQKNQCDEETINFIKEKIKDLVEHKNKKNAKKCNTNAINTILIIMFILSLISIWIGLYFWSSVIENINPNFAMEKICMMAFALPIPLCSLILGIIFSKKGFKCTKNIVAGAIVSVLILIYSSMSMQHLSLYIQYDEINKYKEIISVDIPTNGKYKRIDWDTSTLENLISNYIEFSDVDEDNKFFNDIRNSGKWIESEKVSTSNKSMIPAELIYNEKDCYYLIYNKDTKEYNKQPEKTGKYQYCVMSYNHQYRTLDIQEYTYNYIKE